MATEDDGVDFSWKDTQSIIIEKVDAVAVYSNPKGNIVIRQEDPMGGDDSVIMIPRSMAKELILAIQNELDA